ncbi:MAG: hypothetical protein ACXW4B_00440 [Micavibrio sp.]
MMQKHLFNTVRFFTLVCGITALTGCGWSSESNVRASGPDATMLSGLSLKNIFGFNEAISGPLTVHDAIALGLHHNLESRIARIEPPLTVQPSSFTTLGNGIDYVTATSDSAARERQAAQSIINDVRSAYLRAASAEILEPVITGALHDAETTKAASALAQEKRDDAVQNLKSLSEELSAARSELAVLLGISDPSTLQFAPINDEALPLDTRPQNLELLALSRHPGSASAGAESLRDNALHALPGIREILARSHENAVTEDQWNSFSASFTPGLVRIFSMDLELQQPEHKARLESLQQQALSAAIMAQAHIAYAQYQSALKEREAVQKELRSDSGTDPVLNSLETAAAEAQTYLAEAKLQNAYGRFLDSIGADPLPDNAGQLSVAKLSSALQKQAEANTQISPGNFPDPVAEHAVSTAPILQKVGFALPRTPPRIPPAQKISLKKPPKQLPYARVALLNITDRQIQTLLKAPISEP